LHNSHLIGGKFLGQCEGFLWLAAKPGLEFLVLRPPGTSTNPSHQDDLALAVGVLSNNGRDMTWKDRWQWLKYDRPVVRNPKKRANMFRFLGEEIAHLRR